MLKNEVCVFMHSDLVVLGRKISHYDIVGAACPLVIPARSGINSVRAVFLLRAEGDDLDDGTRYAVENARFFKEIAGAFERLQRCRGGLWVSRGVEPEVWCPQSDPFVGRRSQPGSCQ